MKNLLIITLLFITTLSFGQGGLTLSNGQYVESENGEVRLNLRVDSNNVFELTNDNGGFNKSWFYGDRFTGGGTAQFGWKRTAIMAFDTIIQLTTDYNHPSKVSIMTMQPSFFSLFHNHNGSVLRFTMDDSFSFTGGNLGVGIEPDTSAQLHVAESMILQPITADEAVLLPNKEGRIVMVSTTNSTFKWVGFWGFQNGSWSKF